jgi:anti-anti-sigma factor
LTIEGLNEKEERVPACSEAATRPPQRIAAQGRNRSARFSRVTASLTAMIEKKPERVVIDLSDVTYIDSAGLAALIQAMQKVEDYGGKFLLAGLQETVRSIFEISRLDQVFRIFPDTDTALAVT